MSDVLKTQVLSFLALAQASFVNLNLRTLYLRVKNLGLLLYLFLVCLAEEGSKHNYKIHVMLKQFSKIVYCAICINCFFSSHKLQIKTTCLQIVQDQLLQIMTKILNKVERGKCSYFLKTDSWAVRIPKFLIPVKKGDFICFVLFVH